MLKHLTVLLASLIAAISPINAAELSTYDALESLIHEAAKSDLVTIEDIGRSVENRTLWAVRISAANPDTQTDRTTVLLVGQQHGDEPAGCEALLDLINQFARGETTIDPSVDLWIVPRLNPDGASKQQRRNANDADLNRDHVILAQPETKALYKLVQRIRPHLAVDCHEFGRDSTDYRKQGWTEWPLIMMDTANLAIMPDSLYDLGVQLCDSAGEKLDAAGINFTRYVVGDCPCNESTGELRYSTLDPDDARNGISLYGCMSFIIESGIYREAADPQSDIDKRIEAYHHLFGFFLSDSDRLEQIREAAEKARRVETPAAVPTNVMWANLSPRVTGVRVIDSTAGGVITISTTTFMHDRVVKSAVPMVERYVVSAEHAEAFGSLLDAHDIQFNRLTAVETMMVERSRLLGVEDRYDETYHRYDGRQIVEPTKNESVAFAAGSIVVDIESLDPVDACRAAMILEPRQLFGLYQWPAFRKLVSPDGLLPVSSVRRPIINSTMDQ